MKLKIIILVCCIQYLVTISYSQCYNLVWSDEFDGTTLDDSKWSSQIGGHGWGNNELQYYTGGANNIEVSNSTMKIIAREESINGSNYSSARIRSIGKGDWTYGKMEASIKLPEGQGIWPAFWMMPTESAYGTWPNSGEIDIMEFLGHQTSTIYGTCHYGNDYFDKSSSGNSHNINPNSFVDGNFHHFSIEWEPNQIRWYVDGIHFHTFNATDVGAYTFPFNKDFHFILNLAVGGNWPGNPDATTNFPVVMEIDYVRVFQKITDVGIVGMNRLEPNTQDVVYSVPQIPNTTYAWSLPLGASLTSGLNTNQITVNWGALGGNVEVYISNDCGTACLVYPVEISINQILNSSFENDFKNWSENTFNGASANWNIDINNPHTGLKAMCTEVTALSSNNWDVQISPNQLKTIPGEKYVLKFWAKADANNKEMSIAFIHPTNYTYYSGQSITLTNEWLEYTHIYKATNSTASLNIQFGHETGSFCIDDILFTSIDLFYNKPKVKLPISSSSQGIQLVPR